MHTLWKILLNNSFEYGTLYNIHHTLLGTYNEVYTIISLTLCTNLDFCLNSLEFVIKVYVVVNKNYRL
jgi:hypothetical protein